MSSWWNLPRLIDLTRKEVKFFLGTAEVLIDARLMGRLQRQGSKKSRPFGSSPCSCKDAMHNIYIYIYLVGGWANPPEKCESQIGSSSQLLGKINKISKPPTRYIYIYSVSLVQKSISLYYEVETLQTMWNIPPASAYVLGFQVPSMPQRGWPCCETAQFSPSKKIEWLVASTHLQMFVTTGCICWGMLGTPISSILLIRSNIYI